MCQKCSRVAHLEFPDSVPMCTAFGAFWENPRNITKTCSGNWKTRNILNVFVMFLGFSQNVPKAVHVGTLSGNSKCATLEHFWHDLWSNGHLYFSPSPQLKVFGPLATRMGTFRRYHSWNILSVLQDSLGAEGVIPSRYIVSLLRVFKQLTHTLASR